MGQRPKPRKVWQYGVDPGELRNQIQLASSSATVDGFGQALNTWTPYLTTWASIRLLSGSEQFQSDEFTSAAQYRIVMRSPGTAATVNTGDRVLFGARVFVVQLVDNVDMRDFLLLLTCLEIDGTS